MKKILIGVIALLLGLVSLSPGLVLAKATTYKSKTGATVHVPVKVQQAPVGTTARCKDGTYSYSLTRRGTCSRHGGVSQWLH